MDNLFPALPAELKDTSLIDEWKSLEINDDEQAEVATYRLQAIANKKKMMDEFREQFIRPQKRILADFEAKCRQTLAPFVELETILRTKLGAYMDRMREQRHIELEAQRLEAIKEAQAKQARLEEEIMFGGQDKSALHGLVTTNIAALEALDVKSIRHSIDAGTAKVSESIYWAWEVTDYAQVPQEYFVLDEKKLNEIAKKYSKEPCEIPGIEFKQKARVIVK